MKSPLKRWHIYAALALLAHVAKMVPMAAVFWVLMIFALLDMELE